MSDPLPRRTVLGAGMAAALGMVFAACGGSDDDDAGGTVPLFGGTVPPGGPAIDLTPLQETAGRDVVMIGDSITVASTPGLEAAARQLGVELTIHAEVGRRITVGSDPLPGTDVMEEVLDEGVPDLFVIALGSNDVGKYSTRDEYSAQIRELLDLLPREVPVAWINAWLRDHPDSSALFNSALISALEERGAATIGKWSNIATDDGVLSDGVHPTDDGATLFASLVGDEIANWLD